MQNSSEPVNTQSIDFEYSGHRDQFIFPKDQSGQALLYFCGNSLGLQLKSVEQSVNQVLDQWAQRAVRGHFEGEYPWQDYHRSISEKMAGLVGAKEHEVTIMNTLTVNLHLMLASFYQPTNQRNKILIEEHAFPSDRYAIQSHLNQRSQPQALIEVSMKSNQSYEDQIMEAIESHGESIALILLGCPNYLTGETFDLGNVAQKAKEYGCMVGFDLAHGVGNIPVNLHQLNADFAVWCTYKYLNGGPGSLAGCFVHERHGLDPSVPRLAGWWGHRRETRFKMPNQFIPIPGAEGWQISNLPIFSLAPLKASMDLFAQVGMNTLRNRSIQLTNYLEKGLLELNHPSIQVITPAAPERRGCQLSVQLNEADQSIFHQIRERGVIIDWREPNVFRIAPVPLYNSIADIDQLLGIIQEVLHES